MALVRIEYFGGIDKAFAGANGLLDNAVELAVTSTATAGGARPTIPSLADVRALITAIGGDVYVKFGADPTADEDGKLILDGQSASIDNEPGMLLSFVTRSSTKVLGVAGVPFASADASTAASISDAPATGEKLVVDEVVVSAGAAISVSIQCESSATVLAGPFYMAANSTLSLPIRGLKLPTANKKLQLKASGAGNVSALAKYHSEP